jgi:hypothetical protein
MLDIDATSLTLRPEVTAWLERRWTDDYPVEQNPFKGEHLSMIWPFLELLRGVTACFPCGGWGSDAIDARTLGQRIGLPCFADPKSASAALDKVQLGRLSLRVPPAGFTPLLGGFAVGVSPGGRGELDIECVHAWGAEGRDLQAWTTRIVAPPGGIDGPKEGWSLSAQHQQL